MLKVNGRDVVKNRWSGLSRDPVHAGMNIGKPRDCCENFNFFAMNPGCHHCHLPDKEISSPRRSSDGPVLDRASPLP
jgi:hypothetical protein